MNLPIGKESIKRAVNANVTIKEEKEMNQGQEAEQELTGSNEKTENNEKKKARSKSFKTSENIPLENLVNQPVDKTSEESADKVQRQIVSNIKSDLPIYLL